MCRNTTIKHRCAAGIATVLAALVLTPPAVAQIGTPGQTQTECMVVERQTLVLECPSQTSSSTREQFFEFVSNLGTRISQQRHVVRNTEDSDGSEEDTAAYGTILGGAASADADETGITAYGRLSAFGVADYAGSDREATNSGDAYDQHNEAVILGLDYRISNSLFAGATLNYLAGDTDFTGEAGPNGSTEVDSYILGVHGSKYWNDVFWEALLTYGEFELDIERIAINFVNEHYNAAPDGDLRSADMTLGYVYSRNRWRVTPATKVLYLDGSIDPYTETAGPGGFAGGVRTFERQDFEALNGELSVQIDYVVLKSWGVLIPSLKVAYNHEFKDPHTVKGVRFGGVEPFAEESDAPDSDTATVRLGASAQFKRGWSAFGSFEKLFEHNYIDRNSIVAGVRYEFF